MTTRPSNFTGMSAARQWAADIIKLALDCPLEDAQVDTEALLCHILDCNRSFFITHPDHQFTHEQHSHFCEAIETRCTGKPVAYIIGSRGFWTLDLAVNEHTLIPRPDTEILVDAALGFIAKDTEQHILDMGTGSGAIALSVASERPLCQIIATDFSLDALTVAKHNATANGINNVSFASGSWFDAVQADQAFSVIVSNPPYIPTADQHLHDGSLTHEPYSALASGEDGLDDIRLIINNAAKHLLTNGYLLLEHGYDQGKAVRELFMKHRFTGINTIKDFGNNDRVTLGQWVHSTTERV